MSADGNSRPCALVTGASRGIGRAIATGLAAAGYDVVIHYNANRPAAEEAVALSRGTGVCAWSVQADLSSPAGSDRLLRDTMQAAGRIDVIVNNAAGLWVGEPPDISDPQLEAIFAVNVIAVYRLIAKAGPLLPDGGRIINVSSDAARLPRPFAAAYAASKASLESLTMSFAQWLGVRGVTVNAVAPGPVRTEMMAGFLEDEKTEAALSRSSAQTRVGIPADIVPIVLFLARRESQWVNGQTIEATGGRVAAW